MPGRQRADIVDQHHRQADYGTIPDMGRALLFDETDHLGACFAKNRFDMDSSEQLKEADQVTWDGFSNKVDQHFEGEAWRPPITAASSSARGILEALDRLRPTNWLR
ncbi:hypothetical protein AB7813_13680 [Tardiphaga sp. 20_F10_N6_6]|jgi:hypothetical protein|uniref:Uncharacterized protein n=1 Tax=Tardiphaga robiniae TaxID=943830 RepID=A0A7G6U0Z8_9BRAD|nr:hypothetical protein [Tardiphaga robiniae]QND72680.1 hypothetical protein HB776_16615 [Tardiphaga robiniae]